MFERIRQIWRNFKNKDRSQYGPHGLGCPTYCEKCRPAHREEW